MKRLRLTKLLSLTIFFIFISITSPLYSQQVDVERATRETDLLEQQQKIIQKKLRRPPEKPAEVEIEEAPAEEEKEEAKFFIKKIRLVGTESFPPEEFSYLIEKYENKELTLSQLRALAKEIEQEYLRRGIIAAVFVPPQKIKDQIVILQVVEAKMGKLQIQEHRYFKKGRLRYYWKIPEGEILRYDKISKSIQMMNKNPDRQVKAALRPGEKPGTTDILLIPQTRFPIHFTSTFDNEGAASSGKERLGLGIRHNNFLGLDDTLLTSYISGRNFSGMYAYHNLPINSRGTSLLYGYSRIASTPKKEYAAYEVNSRAKDVTVSLHQDLYKKDDYLGEIFWEFNARDKTVKLNTGTLNRDRLRIISLGGSFIIRGPKSNTYFSPEFSQGVDAFGASPKNNPLASRGAKSVFSKFNLEIQHRRLLPLSMQTKLKFKTQVSSTKLTPQEEFSLGGMNSIRGYPYGDYLADNAVLTSAELLIPSIFIPQNWRLAFSDESLRKQVTTVVFVDYGWGQRRSASPTEKKDVNFLGVGAGFRIKLFGQATLRLEWGFPVGDYPITEAGNSRFHFSVDFQEKLPETIERIKKRQEERLKKI